MPIPGMSAHDFDRSGDPRVATLNLWARSGDWPARRAVLAAGLRALRPDLVAFQEAVANDDDDQVTDLLGAGWHVARSDAREGEGSRTSIASRWPLTDLHELDLNVTPRTADFPCVAMVAEVQAPAPVGPLLFVNANPNFQLPYEHERELQAVTTARFVEKLVSGRSLHVVLAGDFDAAPEAASVAPSLQVVGCALLFDEPVEGVWGSDHFGVVADLAVPRARAQDGERPELRVTGPEQGLERHRSPRT